MRRLNRFLLLLIVPLLLYFFFATISKGLETYQLRQEEQRLQKEILGLQARYQELQAQKEYFNSDVYIEKIAREQLNLIKPGETAIIVVAPTPVPQEQEVAEPAAAEEKPLWQEWLDRGLDVVLRRE